MSKHSNRTGAGLSQSTSLRDKVLGVLRRNWQAKLISLTVAAVVWYLVRSYIDQERDGWLPPDYQPGIASTLTTPWESDRI